MERTDLSVHTSGRNHKFHHRGIRGDVSRTKAAAMRDISRECGKDKMFSKNYLSMEYAIMESAECDFDYLSIE